MKHHQTTGQDVMIEPTTMEEVGFFIWLSKRFKGKSVTLDFDTVTDPDKGTDEKPMLFINEMEK